jgi:O-antigen/teichoic acid export membrane protein
MAAIPVKAGDSNSSLVLKGLFWNTLYQVFATGLGFVAMLIVVRIVPAADYGRWATVVGFLGFINALNCDRVVTHALQIPKEEQPDWSAHWAAALRIQLILCLICNGVALICHLFPAYRSVAPLLHVASLGLIWDSATKVRMTMLRRAMDFRRLRIISVVSYLVSTIATVGMAFMGCGAYALIVGGSVLLNIPGAIDLIFLEKWRPAGGWLRPVRWREYRPALIFGFHQAGTGFLGTARAALESAVLPGTIGFAGMGFWNRSQAIFGTSVGRVQNIVAETVYPLLPQSAGDLAVYRRRATLFVEVMFLLLIPGMLYVGMEGPPLSRLFYGLKWVAVDPCIWPGTLFGAGALLSLSTTNILLGANQLRARTILFSLQAVVGIPALVLAILRRDLLLYAWAMAVAQLVMGVVSFGFVTRLLTDGWVRRVLWPPAVASLAGLPVLLALNCPTPILQVLASALLYGTAVSLVLRFLFPQALYDLLGRLPGGRRLQAWFRLTDRETSG